MTGASLSRISLSASNGNEKLGQIGRSPISIFETLENVRLPLVSAHDLNDGLLPRVGVGAGPQRPAGLVGADDDARAHSLRADEREFAWRGALRKDTLANA